MFSENLNGVFNVFLYARRQTSQIIAPHLVDVTFVFEFVSSFHGFCDIRLKF